MEMCRKKFLKMVNRAYLNFLVPNPVAFEHFGFDLIDLDFQKSNLPVHFLNLGFHCHPMVLAYRYTSSKNEYTPGPGNLIYPGQNTGLWVQDSNVWKNSMKTGYMGPKMNILYGIYWYRRENI
jgi:hypothetical protein